MLGSVCSVVALQELAVFHEASVEVLARDMYPQCLLCLPCCAVFQATRGAVILGGGGEDLGVRCHTSRGHSL